jgi:SagB-type dehydrogenase family enzyme
VRDTLSPLEYHELTVHHPSRLRPRDPRLVRGYQPMDWSRKPPPFKTYPNLDVLPLPRQLPAVPGLPLDHVGLGWLLFLSAGVVRVLETPMGPMWFRAAGSAGNLCPIEVYVLVGEIDGLSGGLYHYQPLEHGLVPLRQLGPETPPALVLTGVPWRTAWKYTERGFRHLYWDAGTMLSQTLDLASTAGLAPRLEMGFLDAAVASLVGATEGQEFPLVVVGLDGPPVLPEPLEAPTGHLADNPVEFPLITDVQRAGDLADEAAVRHWRQAALKASASEANGSSLEPPAYSRSIEEVIRRRGSTRRFDRSHHVPLEALTGAMASATRPVPADFVPPGGTLLEHYLAVHSVEGVQPGAYRWQQGGDLELLRSGPVRDVARHLCLDQELGGNGAYTVFHCAPLDEVVRSLGSRGYRAALLEAGVTGGRLHLAAFDRGIGATGLTFFDHEVSRFFGTEAAPMLVTAVGRPAYRSRMGGLPGQPVSMASG